MATRRQFLASAAATIAASRKTGAYVAAQPSQPLGCTFTADQAPELLYSLDPASIGPSSGDRQLDYAFAQTLSHLTDTFHVLPSFVFYREPISYNALASPLPREPGTDGTVLFGRRMLHRCLSLPEAPDAAIACTCAHEFGHIVQNQRSLRRRLKEPQEGVRRLELHADFMAGYFAGIRKLKRNDFPAAVFATTQYSVGDNNFFSPLHHGTPDERAAAIVRGYEAAYRDRLSLDDAIEIGISFVTA